MLESLIQAALKQRLVLVVVAVCLVAFGMDATRKLSVDAFPDVTNVQLPRRLWAVHPRKSNASLPCRWKWL
jgi:Cu/Ag efflux pump CusA